MNPIPGIGLQAICLTLGQHRIFERLTLHFEPGRWHSILGRSGAGKSCLLRMVSGLQKPDSGSISTCNGQPVSQQLAYMAQDDGLLPWLSCVENVQLGSRLRGQRNASSKQRAMQLLQRVGLVDWADALPAVLSGGMRQRIALARTLFEDQPVVLMDEPFSRLDAITRDELQKLAFKLLSHRTVLLVTHDPLEALQLSHEIHVLNSQLPSTAHSMQLATRPPRSLEDASVMQCLPEVWHHLRTNLPQVQNA